MHRHCVNKNYSVNLLYLAKCQIDHENAACPDFATLNRLESLKWTWTEKCKNLLCPQSFVERTLGCGMVVFVHSWNKTLFYHPGCYCCYFVLLNKHQVAGSVISGWIEPKLACADLPHIISARVLSHQLTPTRPNHIQRKRNLMFQSKTKKWLRTLTPIFVSSKSGNKKMEHWDREGQIATVQNSFAVILFNYLNATSTFLLSKQIKLMLPAHWHIWMP